MHILAIDSSGGAVGAAIADEQGLTGQLELAAGRQASQTLLPLTQNLLDLCNLSLAEMDALAVTAGPGSFTGLRIGLATVKAWAQALAKPLVAVSTLQALAYGAYERGFLICPILNARRGQLFAALFKEGRRLLDDLLLTPKQLARRLDEWPEPVIFCGEGLAEAQAQLAALLGSRMLLAPPSRHCFLAGSAALVGRQLYLSRQLADASTLEPAYLRPAAAEEQRREAQKNG